MLTKQPFDNKLAYWVDFLRWENLHISVELSEYQGTLLP